MKKGIFYAITAYVFWGIHPLFWRLLKDAPSIEVVSHRILWSLVFFSIILFASRGWRTLWAKIKSTPNKAVILVPALLIGSNWFLYVWAVNNGYVIETSYGYFICPLLSVLLGVVVLKEKLNRLQWIAAGIAFAGVMVMTLFYGQFPWLSLALAGTWGTYGLIRKKSPLTAVEGLTLESALLAPIALYILITRTAAGSNTAIPVDFTLLLFAGSGLISGLPLLIFISAAKKLPLSLVGILQYIYPTLIFIVGYFLFKEELDQGKLFGFIFIWAALILYSLDNVRTLAKLKRAAAADSDPVTEPAREP